MTEQNKQPAESQAPTTAQMVTLVLASTQAFTEAPHQHKGEPDQRAMDLDATLSDIAGQDSSKPANDADGEERRAA